MENKRPIPDENEIEDLKERMEQYMGVIRTATDMSGLPPEMLVDFLGDEILRILEESGASKRERDQHIRELTSKMRKNRVPSIQENQPTHDSSRESNPDLVQNHRVRRSGVPNVCQRNTLHHV